MIKDIAISLLAGIAIAQRITQLGDPARVAVTLTAAVIVFMILLELEDLWDKRIQIMQWLCSIIGVISICLPRIMHHTSSRFRWCLIQLRTWSVEMVQRRQRRQTLTGCIERLRAMGEVKRDDVQCM